MARSVLAGVLGIVVMLLMVAGLQWIGHSIWPPPPGLDFTHPAAWEAMLAMMPTVAKAWVILAYGVATFLGAGTAATIAKEHKRGVALLVGVAMLALVGLNFESYPHPTWMLVGGLGLPLPAALLGWRVFR